jgi:hypothetical protein
MTPANPRISKNNDANNKTITFQVPQSDSTTYQLKGLDAFLEDQNGATAPASVNVTKDSPAGPYSVLSFITPTDPPTSYTVTINNPPVLLEDAEPGLIASGSAQIQVDP